MSKDDEKEKQSHPRQGEVDTSSPGVVEALSCSKEEVAAAQLNQIISGGQTGVDRAALDAALDASFPCGGWCPEGRLASDGVLPERYPLQELPGAGYRQRTIKNLTEADGTLIVYYGKPVGGTEMTLLECIRRHKPYCLVDAAAVSEAQAMVMLLRFVGRYGIRVLNVAGPGASREPAAYGFTYRVIMGVLRAGRSA